MFNFKQYDWKRYNISMVAIVILLCLVGAFCVYLSDGTSLLKRQILGLFLGIFIMGFVSIMDYHFICRFAIVYYFIGVIMLVLVKFSPLGVDHTTGVKRWINLGFTDIQPSELCKIMLIVVLASVLSKLREKMNKFYVFLLVALIAAIPSILILIQTDLSSSMVMVFVFMVMVYVAGLSYRIIAGLLAVGVPATVAFLWYVQQDYQLILKPWQQERILAYLNPEMYADSGMYQQNNSISAIASGNVYGKLLMDSASEYRKYRTVYVNESDFIFSIIGEEFGFIGSCIVIGLLMVVIIKCILIAKRAHDFTGMLVATGASAMFMFQVFANIGVATAILPNTGLPLPFLSYGLSSLVSYMIAIGLVINVGVQKRSTRG